MNSRSPKNKTVFVLGAGASKEVNLPVGAELKMQIAESLDIRFPDGYQQVSGNRIIKDAISLAAEKANPPTRNINPYLYKAWHVRDAMPQAISIDNFIDAHSGDSQIELCGKLAIVQTILKAESNSLLYINSRSVERKLNYSQIEKTWFNAFFQLLTLNHRKEDIEARLASIALIIFNYDRCFEHYLYHALQNYYFISPQEAASLLRVVEIYHPYGTVGSLPWLSGTNAIEFGAEPYPQQLIELAKQIKTFTEGTDKSSSEIESIRALMATSSRLVILGFAFNQLNMDMLFPKPYPTEQSADRQVFSTAKGFSHSDTEEIRSELNMAGGIHISKIRIENTLTCCDLFREYSRSLKIA